MKNVADIYALSPMQELMFLHALTAESDEDVLFNQIVYRFAGELDTAAFQQAWQTIVDRHPAFRTMFVWQKSKDPVQVVRTQVPIPWAEHDWREMPPEEQSRCLDELLAADRAVGFDPLRPPLMRIILIRLADEATLMIWSSHHLIIDRWCIALVFAELAQLYDANLVQKVPALAPAPRYRDYIAWLSVKDEEAAARYWRDSLRELQARPLPLAPAKKNQAPLLATKRTILSPEETEVLQSFAADHNLTIGTLVPAAWAVVLSAATHAEDVLFGQTVSGRPSELPQINNMIGCFINNVPLRVRLAPATPVADWLRDLQDRQLSLQDFEYVSPAQIQAWTEGDDLGLLFDTLVLVQAPVHYAKLAGLELSLERGSLQTGYPLSIAALVEHSRLHLTFTYDRHRVTEEMVDQLARALHQVLVTLAGAWDEPLAALQAVVDIDLLPLAGQSKNVPLPRADSERPYTPPRNETEIRLAQIWSEMLEISPVGIHDNFFEIGGHSLSTTQLISRIRDQFGVDLPLRILIEDPTIAHLALALGDAAPALKHPVLLPINRTGTRPPFFFAHGMFGVVSYLANLGSLMAADQPIYGLEAIGLHPDAEPDRQLEQMAARAIDAMRVIQPSGPYYVGGFCFGGVLAFEIARQLSAAGERLGIVAIIEASAPEKFHKEVPITNPQRLLVLRQTAPFWLRGYKEYGGWQFRERFRTAIFGRDNYGTRVNGQGDFDVEFDNAGDINMLRPQIQKDLRIISEHAFDIYDPQTYGGRVTFFRASCIRVGHALQEKFDPLRGWGELAHGGVGLRFVQGTHVGILDQPYVADLAAQLTQAIAEAQAANHQETAIPAREAA